MIDNEKMIKITNRSVGSIGYSLPELAIKRRFMYRETKEVPFKELNALYNNKGGRNLILKYLAIKDKDAIAELGFDVEPEYFYEEDDVIRVMEKGSLEEFLDMLDFAPEGVIEMVKTLAVQRELNDMNKRKAILEKVGFDVTKGIEAKNANFDDGSSADTFNKEKVVRRVALSNNSKDSTQETIPVRRVATSK